MHVQSNIPPSADAMDKTMSCGGGNVDEDGIEIIEVSRESEKSYKPLFRHAVESALGPTQLLAGFHIEEGEESSLTIAPLSIS